MKYKSSISNPLPTLKHEFVCCQSSKISNPTDNPDPTPFAFGRSIINRLFRRRLRENDRFVEVVDRVLHERQINLPLSFDARPDWVQLKSKWVALIKRLDAASGSKTSDGNRLTLVYPSPVDELLSAIKSAKFRVWIATYIFDESIVADDVVNELVKARQRGVDVILSVDWLGSISMKSESKHRLRESGVVFFEYNDWKRLGHRDHRKIAIIDEIGYTGSANIMKEAGTSNIGGNNEFLDVQVKIEGPAVAHLAEVFLSSFSGSTIFRHPILPPPPIPYERGGGAFVQVLESNPRNHIASIQLAYRSALSNASNIFAMPGYFSPPWLLKRQIKFALKNGAKMSILLSGHSDIWGDEWSAKATISRYFKWGDLSVFFTSDHHCHGKFLIIDGIWSIVGSANLDR